MRSAAEPATAGLLFSANPSFKAGMNPQTLDSLLAFLRAAERLKDTLRSAHTTSGRQESTAEHTWRLCLMALVFEPHFPGIDFARLIRICLVHDLGEAVRGDIPAPLQAAGVSKAGREREDLRALLAVLPESQRDEIAALWEEYETAATPEARLAKAFDKLETILQHTQGKNPGGFDYRFNLGYGRAYTDVDPTLRLIRDVLDRETERLARAAEEASPERR